MTANSLEAHDGLQIYCETHEASEQGSAILVVVHDLSAHVGTYRKVLTRLAEGGLTVYALDLRGHGHSRGERASIDSFDDYLDDLDLLMARIKDQNLESSRPLFLLGEGLGALIAARFVATRQPRLRGLILSGPLTDLPLSPWEKTVVQLPFRLFSKRRCSLPAEGEWLASQTSEIATDDSLLFRGQLTLGTAREIIGACRSLYGQPLPLTAGLLMLQGRSSSTSNRQALAELHDTALTFDKTVLEYDAIDRNPLLHQESERVVADILRWCEAHSGQEELEENDDEDGEEAI